MSGKKQLFASIAEEYALTLLNWAYKKLGNREQAEDLAQEVLLQIFAAISKSEEEIGQLSHFVWKVAHYTWCNYLRKQEHYRMYVPIEETELADEDDFVSEFAENEEKQQVLGWLRRQISRLNYLQREIMIAFYIDGASIREIAKRQNLTEATVKWHLFQTRKNMKKEMADMKQEEYVYRPRKLHMGINGQAVSELATKQINSNLVMQNICIACYEKEQTVQQMVDLLGIPAAYIENDLEWLVAQEFVAEEKGKYRTMFMIETAEQEQEKYAIYLKHRAQISDVIVQELLAAEDTIRKIGFYGSDRPMEKLLWQLIYTFCDYQKSAERCQVFEAPIRPDGGRYFPMGFDRTDMENEKKVLNVTGWAQNGSMYNDGFSWYGLYNFGVSEIEDMLDAYSAEAANIHQLLKEIISKGVGADISGYAKEKQYELAKMAQKGFIRMEGGKAYPNFTVFTKEQYAALVEQVFAPLAKKLFGAVEALMKDLESYGKNKLPAHLSDYQGLLVRMALVDMAYVTTILAFEDGKLYHPMTKEDGEFLTLMYMA